MRVFDIPTGDIGQMLMSDIQCSNCKRVVPIWDAVVEATDQYADVDGQKRRFFLMLEGSPCECGTNSGIWLANEDVNAAPVSLQPMARTGLPGESQVYLN